MRIVALAFALLLSAGPPMVAKACEPVLNPKPGPDKHISILADGSFENAAEDDTNLKFAGKPVVNIGNGRVGQRIRASAGCGAQELLLVADCTSGEMIVVTGVYDNDPETSVGIGGFIDLTIDPLLYPRGPIRLSKMGVAEIAEVAKHSGYEFTLDVAREIGKMKKRNRYDPLFGCKLFYPGSPGALG